jgi:type IV pilus assembly protein PilF
MENSVMPTSQQEANVKAESARANEQKNASKTAVQKTFVNDKETEKKLDKKTRKLTVNKPENVSNIKTDTAPVTEVKDEENRAPVVSLPIHVVAKGDSLFAISKQYNIVMKSLERWNKLGRPYLLKIGDVIYLADPKSAAKR